MNSRWWQRTRRARGRACACTRGPARSGLRVWRRHMTNRTKWAAAGVLIVLLWAVLYPNIFVLRDSLVAGGRFTFEHYYRFSQSNAELRALWNSVWISTIS